ncbi:hypothetical protein GPX89_35810 [Nocardia sp. ET3-3]|uniref:Uncharacterized protein n=1 Tax=Nocardia terrae TaxID=2675851 RepID=A0A7K1V7G4_9NOCA|nr:hypothetical protein [Nocardia terrae]MVU82585.1 hypothetical protein [Nocardia terrae]
MSDNDSRFPRLRRMVRRATEAVAQGPAPVGAPPAQVGDLPVAESVTLRMPSRKVCPRLPEWVFTLNGSEFQKMLDCDHPLPPALTVSDYLAHQQRHLAIRLVMDPPNGRKPRSVVEFVQRCDAEELRAIWAETLGGDALIATATAGPLPALSLLAAEMLDRAHRWQDLLELEHASEVAGFRARELFKDYVHGDRAEAANLDWGATGRI